MNIKLRLVFVLFLLSSVYVQAQVPVNDLCEDAITVVCGDVVQGNTEQSTNASSPEDGCGTTNGAPGNWYFFEGNGDIVDLSLCSVTDYDTKIRVYSGNCFSLTCVGGNDDSCGLRSEFTFTSDASTNYFIYVFGFGAGTGDYELTLTCTSPPPPPANDDCDGAITALVNENENCTLINPGTLEGATTSNVPNICPGTANDDVWFQFTATATSHLIQFDNIQGAPTNINHAVFEGVDCDSLINISCSDPNQSLVQNLTIGDTYYIRLYSSGTIPFVTTTFDLCISQLPEPPVNDECDEAIVVAVNPDDTWTLTTAGALGGATDSNIVNGCGGFADDDVWFSFIADSSIHIIELLNVAGSPTDVTFSIFEGPCDTLAEFACSNGLEAFVPGLTIGQDYFIRVFTEGANPINNTTFDVCVRQAITEVLCDGEPTTGTTSYFATLEVELSDGSIEIIQEEVIVERETGCINFDCTDTLLFETFGTGTGAATDPFVTIPFDGIGGLAEGAYVISNTLVGLNPFWHFDLEDHTPDDTDGRMLIINASGNDANAELYRRPLTLETNTEYGLRFWLATVYDIETNICPENGGLGIPSNLIYQIEAPDGTIIASGTTGDVDNTAEPLWQPFNLEFNSGTNTDVELVFINNILGVCGNDFAIDDIGLFFEGEPPVIVMPEDISECDEDENGQVIFDLTAQNAEILDGLDPADFAIFFYNSEEDAINRNNPIVTPGAYTNVSDPETIWVRVERANQDSCFSITSFQISLEPQVDLGVMFDPFFEICSNEAFPAIDGTPTNPDIDISGFEYEWRDANGTIVATTAIFVPTQGGVYTLVITGDFCGEDTFITEVVVQPAPVLDLGPTQTFCEGEQAFEIIPIITGDTTGITYQWSTGETTETIIVNETGTYTLTITVGLCTVTNSVDVNFLENPIVDLGADFKSCPGEVTLTATIVNEEEGVNYSYIWFGPDGEISGETQATLVTTIEPDLLGAVVFSVVVLNGDCEGTDEVEISLYDIDNCIISQGISPNGDSLNDMLDLEFLNDRSGIDNLKIFNRLGTLVYERNNYINEWFGQTTDGEELPTGTYYYVIALENEDMTYGREAAGFIYLNREP